jgi:hypothetical protein
MDVVKIVLPVAGQIILVTRPSQHQEKPLVGWHDDRLTVHMQWVLRSPLQQVLSVNSACALKFMQISNTQIHTGRLMCCLTTGVVTTSLFDPQELDKPIMGTGL